MDTSYNDLFAPEPISSYKPDSIMANEDELLTDMSNLPNLIRFQNESSVKFAYKTYHTLNFIK